MAKVQKIVVIKMPKSPTGGPRLVVRVETLNRKGRWVAGEVLREFQLPDRELTEQEYRDLTQELGMALLDQAVPPDRKDDIPR